MANSKNGILVFVGFIILMLNACATVPKGAVLVDSPAELPSIQQEKATLLSQLKIGASLAEFQKLVPGKHMGQDRMIKQLHTSLYMSKNM